MGKRYLITIVLACLGMASILTLQGSPRVAQVLSTLGVAQNPVNTIEEFYSVLERGDWLRVRALTTEKFWLELESTGQKQTWQAAFKRDKSLAFKGFSVQNSQIEEQTALIQGRAQWQSDLGTVPQTSQTIGLAKGKGGWRISSIRNKEATGVAQSLNRY